MKRAAAVLIPEASIAVLNLRQFKALLD